MQTDADTDTGDVTALTLALETARDIHAVMPPESPFEAITLHGMRIAVASVRLVEARGKRSQPWWVGTANPGSGAMCIGCYSTPPFDLHTDWTAIKHPKNCPALELDAAIRAAGEPTS